MALRLDPHRGFTQTTQLGRLETTGETYAFDSNGMLLSDSRFDERLRRAGLIPEGEDSILNLEVRDPGGNTDEGFRPQTSRSLQPLTRMALSASSGKSGTELNGYRDYRGVSVVETWLWDNELGMGVGYGNGYCGSIWPIPPGPRTGLVHVAFDRSGELRPDVDSSAA